MDQGIPGWKLHLSEIGPKTKGIKLAISEQRPAYIVYKKQLCKSASIRVYICRSFFSRPIGIHVDIIYISYIYCINTS